MGPALPRQCHAHGSGANKPSILPHAHQPLERSRLGQHPTAAACFLAPSSCWEPPTPAGRVAAAATLQVAAATSCGGVPSTFPRNAR